MSLKFQTNVGLYLTAILLGLCLFDFLVPEPETAFWNYIRVCTGRLLKAAAIIEKVMLPRVDWHLQPLHWKFYCLIHLQELKISSWVFLAHV